MNYTVQIQGTVDPMDKPKHQKIQAIAQAAVDQITALDATVESAIADTPSGAITPMPKTVQQPTPEA